MSSELELDVCHSGGAIWRMFARYRQVWCSLQGQPCVIHTWAPWGEVSLKALYKYTLPYLTILQVERASQKFKRGSHDHNNTSFRGSFIICWIVLATVNLCTKFEVPSFTLWPKCLRVYYSTSAKDLLTRLLKKLWTNFHETWWMGQEQIEHRLPWYLHQLLRIITFLNHCQP